MISHVHYYVPCLRVASTVGYGDFAPKTDTAKIVAIFFIPLAVGCMGEWLGLVANWIMQKQMSKFHKHYMTEGLSQTDLDIMDKDGDGEVTRAEFLEFMLVAMHKMDSDLVETLRKHFDRLDVDGTGILDRADLIHQARQQLKTSEHKMELLAYKQKLLGTTRTETTLQGLPAQWTNTLWKVGAGGKNP